MINKLHQIISPCNGVIRQVFVAEGAYVYEWEKLLVIDSEEGKQYSLTVGASGIVKLDVPVGSKIQQNSVLGYIRDDLVISGSD